ncbi:hypothetical protein DXZ79_16360 [Yersinia rochesterensis]|uniref:Uncharacterized protein n=1 Tax=Yersinia rochesterensis TaxID=1604335 RepID=A0A8E4BMV8_9GAMM|nr:hypothetical protein DXZ79_16360 [Yersinia rochesterensis]
MTYLSKFIGICSIAVFLQLELFWVYTRRLSRRRIVGRYHLPKSLSYLNSLGSFYCRLPATRNLLGIT